MALINGLVFTIALVSSIVGENKTVPKAYRQNLNELHECLYEKGVDASKYGEYTIANIELLTLSYASKLDGNKDYSVKWSRVLTDFDGNPFLLVKLNQGFGVYSVLNSVFAEMTTVGDINPFGEFAFARKKLKYVWLNDYYVQNNDGAYVGLRNVSVIDDDESVGELADLSKYVDKKFYEMRDKYKEEYVFYNTENLNYTTLYDDGTRGGGSTPTTITTIFVDEVWDNYEIPNSWYFEKNYHGFPENTDGSCGYTALSLLLGYNEFFKCAGYFSDKESDKYIEPAVGDIFGEAVPSINDDFPTDIWGDGISGSVSWTIKEAAAKFLRNKPVEHRHYDRLWEFGSVLTPIKNGFPAILFGWRFPTANKKNPYTGMHAITVYAAHMMNVTTAYHLSYITCHYGWSGYSKFTIPFPSFIDQGSIYSLFNQSGHVCKGYFRNETGTVIKCGCGKVVVQ